MLNKESIDVLSCDKNYFSCSGSGMYWVLFLTNQFDREAVWMDSKFCASSCNSRPGKTLRNSSVSVGNSELEGLRDGLYKRK